MCPQSFFKSEFLDFLQVFCLKAFLNANKHPHLILFFYLTSALPSFLAYTPTSFGFDFGLWGHVCKPRTGWLASQLPSEFVTTDYFPCVATTNLSVLVETSGMSYKQPFLFAIVLSSPLTVVWVNIYFASIYSVPPMVSQFHRKAYQILSSKNFNAFWIESKSWASKILADAAREISA